MKKKVKEAILNFLNEAGVFIFTVLGVLAFKYIPIAEDILNNGGMFAIPEWGQIIASLILGTVVALKEDSGGDPIGKRKNLANRLKHAFFAGIGWRLIIGGLG